MRNEEIILASARTRILGYKSSVVPSAWPLRKDDTHKSRNGPNFFGPLNDAKL